MPRFLRQGGLLGISGVEMKIGSLRFAQWFPLPPPQDLAAQSQVPLWTGITGMLRRGSRNGNPLEADSALLLEDFFPVNAIVISDQPPPTCQGRGRCRHSTIAPSSSVLDLGVDEKLQPRSKSHFYFSLRSDHKRLHDPCKEEGARGFMTHWLHTGHYWLFRGDQGESTLGTERYIGMLRNCYYRASLHIVPCSRKSRPHTL
jgi:hypothetical protein